MECNQGPTKVKSRKVMTYFATCPYYIVHILYYIKYANWFALVAFGDGGVIIANQFEQI